MRTVLIAGATGGFSPILAGHYAAKDDLILLHGSSQHKPDNLCLKINPGDHLRFIANPLESNSATQDLYNSVKSNNTLPNIVIHHLGESLGIKSALATQFGQTTSIGRQNGSLCGCRRQ